MFNRKLQEVRLQSLQAQMDFFEILQNRHAIWGDDTNDPELTRMHLEVINLLRQASNTYKNLLNRYKERIP